MQVDSQTVVGEKGRLARLADLRNLASQLESKSIVVRQLPVVALPLKTSSSLKAVIGSLLKIWRLWRGRSGLS